MAAEHELSKGEVRELVGPFRADQVDRFNHFGYGYLVTGLEIARRLNSPVPEAELTRVLARQARLKEAVWSLYGLSASPRRVRKVSAPLHRDEIESALIHSGAIANESDNKVLAARIKRLLGSLKSLHGQKGYLSQITGAVGAAYVASRKQLLARLGEKGPAFERAHHEAQGHLQELLQIRQPLRL